MWRFFSVLNPRPYDLQTSLRLEFYDANVQLLVKNDGRRWIYVVSAHDFRYTLVQRAFEYRLGGTVCDVGRCEAKLDRIVSQELASFLRHLCKRQQDLKSLTRGTHDVIVVLLTQYQTKLGMVMVGILEFRTENNHHAVLQEIIELYGVRVEALTLQVMDSKERGCY